jgi:adenylosuccinate synthase
MLRFSLGKANVARQTFDLHSEKLKKKLGTTMMDVGRTTFHQLQRKKRKMSKVQKQMEPKVDEVRDEGHKEMEVHAVSARDESEDLSEQRKCEFKSLT